MTPSTRWSSIRSVTGVESKADGVAGTVRALRREPARDHLVVVDACRAKPVGCDGVDARRPPLSRSRGPHGCRPGKPLGGRLRRRRPRRGRHSCRPGARLGASSPASPANAAELRRSLHALPLLRRSNGPGVTQHFRNGLARPLRWMLVCGDPLPALGGHQMTAARPGPGRPGLRSPSDIVGGMPDLMTVDRRVEEVADKREELRALARFALHPVAPEQHVRGGSDSRTTQSKGPWPRRAQPRHDRRHARLRQAVERQGAAEPESP